MAEKTAAEGQDDLFVALGNLTGKSMAHMKAVIDKGDSVLMESYESAVEDYIETFNHAVTQGMPPEWALFAFSQAFAITLGQCIRAGISAKEGGRILASIIQTIDTTDKMVKQVTTN